MPPRTVGDYADVLFNGVITRHLVAGVKSGSSSTPVSTLATTPIKRHGGSHRPHKNLDEACRERKEGQCEQPDGNCGRSMSVLLTEPRGTEQRSLPPGSRSSRRTEEREIPRSRYLRNSLWNGCERLLDPSADSSETAVQLQRPPDSYLDDPGAWGAIKSYPELFQVWTPPIDVDHSNLSSLLIPTEHSSNRSSGIQGSILATCTQRPELREERHNRGTCTMNKEVIRGLRDEELGERQWSPPFDDCFRGCI
ncbi:hypothetical protein BT69DRAFT_207060 [Atractiella rhizophila]|nr:hypothetical protein BT69DRAFT_207060 [Atractiella rhizophila]